MTKTYCIFFSLLFASITSFFAQGQIRGVVIDDATESPVPFATVFLANTSIGTTSDQEGRFTLKAPAGQHTVVVQFVGYEPFIFQVDDGQSEDTYTIRLSQEVRVLPSVEVRGERDMLWHEHLKTFKRYFLGESVNGQACTIRNENDLIMDYENGGLRVYAAKPLIIVNKNLGYELAYTLVEFHYAPSEGKVYFSGYPFFKDLMAKNKGAERKIATNRARAYRGSPAHIARSLLDANLDAENFEVRKLLRVPNPKRPDEKVINTAALHYIHSSDQAEKDSLIDNIISKRSLPTFLDMLDKRPLKAQDVLIADSLGNTYLSDANLWQVTFKGESPDINYMQQGGNSRSKKEQVTVIHLLNGKERIDPTGHFTDPMNLLLEGYMGWEKVGELLPLEYRMPALGR